MGDAVRLPMPPPVIGAGELERDAKGLRADLVTGSLLPSSAGDGSPESGLLLDELLDAVSSTSSAPSVFAADCDAVAEVASGGGELAAGLPGPDVN